MKKITFLSLLMLLSASVMNLWAQASTAQPEMPENGKTYYISCATYYGGKYVLRYLYDAGGTLTTSTELSEGNDSYQWTCQSDGTNYTFKCGTGRYLAHKIVQSAEYQFEVRDKGVGTYPGAFALWSSKAAADGKGRYMCLKNDGASFDQLTTPWDQTKQGYSSDFVFQPTVVVTGTKLTVNSNIVEAQAKISWNNETKPAPATFVYNGTVSAPEVTATASNPAYRFANFTENGNTTPTLSIATLDANRTVTANFELDVFSKEYGEKWVRLILANGKGYAANLPQATTYEGAVPNTSPTSLISDAQLWCLVGDINGFKLYNKLSGAGYALSTQGNSYYDGTYTKMVAESQAIQWHLINGFNYPVKGYCISPVGHEIYGLNSYGGEGHDLRFYKNGDQGNQWTVQLAGENGLSINVEVQGSSAATNTRVGSVAVTYGGMSANVDLTTDAESTTVFLPAGATFSLARGSAQYRGYEFLGFNVNGKIEQTITNAVTQEGGSVVTAMFAATNDKAQYLFYSPSADGKPYRIPAIAQAANGNLLAFSDYRPCGADIGNGEVDILCRISRDNGETWEKPFTIADGTGISKTFSCGFGDAAVVADRESNRVLMICVAGNTFYTQTTRNNPLPVARFYSNDGGETWSDYTEITEDIYTLFDNSSLGKIKGLFFGSGRIMQSRIVKVDKYYRLYAALCARDNGNRVIYSDDFGETWHPLGSIDKSPAPYGDEPKCEELPDGSVVLSSRKSRGRYFNIFTFTDRNAGQGNWGTAVDTYNVSYSVHTGGNSTNGEIQLVSVINNETKAKEKIMLQSIPTGTGRSNVSIYYRPIENKAYTPAEFAKNWTMGLEVSKIGSAYSTMTIQDDGRIGFYFEEEPANYCMVYIPLTIEEITDGKYTIDADVYSGVEAIENGIETSSNGDIYDLYGRKITTPAQGSIYIINGKKVIKK